MPFALDAIRKLGGRRHEVFACDSYDASPGSHSRYLAGHFTTASPSGDPEQFAADVERIARENGIELVLPRAGALRAAQPQRASSSSWRCRRDHLGWPADPGAAGRRRRLLEQLTGNARSA